jgi:hypothetical protein
MKNENTKTENKFIVLSMGIATVLLVMSLLSLLVTPVFSAVNDTFQANVTVGNSPPTVAGVNLNDSDGVTIQLTVSSTTRVMCNATLTDLNGYSDIVGANSTFYHSSSTSGASDDINSHYTNNTCTLFGGTGTTIYANCTVNLSFAAINGTWTCNVTAWDNATTSGSATGTNTVDQLVALSIWNSSIDFGAMTNGQNTTTAQGVNISNEGNVMIDIAVKSQTATMSCLGSADCIGAIGVGNMTFNLTAGTYDNMISGFNLTTTNQTVTAFNLTAKGIDTADTVNATRNLYWGIQIPQAVKGEFNTNITISALIG